MTFKTKRFMKDMKYVFSYLLCLIITYQFIYAIGDKEAIALNIMIFHVFIWTCATFFYAIILILVIGGHTFLTWLSERLHERWFE